MTSVINAVVGKLIQILIRGASDLNKNNRTLRCKKIIKNKYTKTTKLQSSLQHTYINVLPMYREPF